MSHSQSKLTTSIIYTLMYSDIFNFPLTLDEIYTRLIGIRTSKTNVHKELLKLLESKQAFNTGKFFYLRNKRHTITERVRRKKISENKKLYAQRLMSLIKTIPTIQAVYITGSVAVNNARIKDDIDLMVVTKPNKLWTTRLFLNIILDLLHKRRKPSHKSFSNKLCTNIFLTSTSLSVPPKIRNIHSAYELIQMEPLFFNNISPSTILDQNQWAFRYLPNATSLLKTKSLQTNKSHTRLNINLKNLRNSRNPHTNSSITEKLIFKLQYVYMKPKITNEKISQDYAYFHPNQLSKKIIAKLTKQSEMYNIEPWDKFIRSFI